MCLWSLRLSLPWSLATSPICSCCKKTTASLFALDDPSNPQTPSADWLTQGSRGKATYKNPRQSAVVILNFGQYVSSINVGQRPPQCDFVLCTADKSHVLLAELKIAKMRQMRHHRKKAKVQLFTTLSSLLGAASVAEDIRGAAIKACCLFHQRPSFSSELMIKAPDSFHRRDSPEPENGEKKENLAIEGLGFEYWEYTAHQQYKFA